MTLRDIEHRGNLPLFDAVTDEARVAAAAERQRERIEKDGLAAPVSPVSTARPRENSISSRSITTMSRIERRASMRVQFLTETQFLEGPGDIGALVLARLETADFTRL